MIGAIAGLFPVCSQLRKYAAADIVLSLTKLKKHQIESKFFVSIFQKLA